VPQGLAKVLQLGTVTLVRYLIRDTPTTGEHTLLGTPEAEKAQREVTNLNRDVRVPCQRL